jgi:hypothetical protein
MPVASVILAFLVGGFLGCLAMALACAARNREEFSEAMHLQRSFNLPQYRDEHRPESDPPLDP